MRNSVVFNKFFFVIPFLLIVLVIGCNEDEESTTPPIAGFKAEQNVVEEKSEIQFFDQSEGTVTAWNWRFEGGDPETSDKNNPLVRYDKSGIYSVSLTVSNSSSQDSITRTGFIVVLPIDSLLAYYPLNGNAKDLSGNELDGNTFETQPEPNRRNQRDSSLFFNGVDSNVDLGDILDEYFTGSAKFSLSFWIYPEAIMDNNLILAKLADSGCSEDQRQFTVRIVDNKINALFYYSLFPNN